MSRERIPQMGDIPQRDKRVNLDLEEREITGESPPKIILPGENQSPPLNFVIVEGGNPKIERRIENGELILVHESGRDTVHWKQIVALAVGVAGAVGLGIGIREVIKHYHSKTPGQSATKRPAG